MTTHADPTVRAAALRALAWTGDTDLLPRFEAVAEQDNSFNTVNACVLFGEAIIERGGKWDAGMAVLEELAVTQTDTVLRQTAMMAIAKHGDSGAVKTLIVAAGDDAALQPTLITALATLPGLGASRKIAEVFPTLTPEIQLGLLRTRGAKTEEPFLALLKAGLESDDTDIRAVSEATLIKAAQPEVIPTLVNRIKATSGDEKAAAIESLAQLARAMQTARPGAAGMAWLKVLNLSETDDMKIGALKGLAAYPVVPAADAVKAAAENDALRTAAVPAMVSIASALADANQRDTARALLQDAMSLDHSPENMARIGPIMSRVQAWEEMGFLVSWQLIGPFAWQDKEADWKHTFVGEPNVDVSKPVGYGDGQREWKEHKTEDPSGVVNLIGTIGQVDSSFAYAYTEFESETGGDARLLMGSDDGLRAWLNGELVHDNNVDRGLIHDQDVTPVTLKKGHNTLLLKISQGGGGWAFCCRVTLADGKPAKLK
jgi:hypothetical protein